ncbi:hypothetical protein BPY_23220 [Bifidobacterium psychraerophilum]|uniref:terminase small subunit n=1 Tax=Bifidobacterium psychraerophilum TaxID=218140 RepID=UPI003113D138
MADRFPDSTVCDALDRSIRNAKHLRAKDSAAIAAARALAWKIDHWDRLAEIALERAHEDGSRPTIPQNDNTSLPAFLKYCDALGLITKEVAVEKPADGTKTDKSKAEPRKPSNKILAFRTAN